MSLPTTGVLFSGSTPAAPPGNQLCTPQTDGGTPAQIVSFAPRLATADKAGVVRPDGTTLAVDVNGVMSAIATGTGPGGGGTSASGGLYVCVSPTQDPADGTGTQFILPAPQLAGTVGWLVRDDTMQRQLGSKAQFSVQGTQLTLKYPLEADADSYIEYYYIQGTPNSQTGGGGSVTPVAPGTIRGTSTGAAATGSNSFAVAWPTGTAVGDFVVIFADSDWNLATPSGWTANDLSNGSTWNGTVISKMMTSGDITAGSVTITSAGNQDYAFIAVAFIGPTGGMREADGLLNGAGVPFTVTTSGAVQATDVGLYFASGRASGTAWTIGRGAALTAVTGPNSQSNLNAEAITAGGAVSVPFTVSGGGAGRYNAVVIIKGS